MALLCTLRCQVKQYPFTTNASLLTSIVLTPIIIDSLTSQMSHFWKNEALFHFRHLVDIRTRTLHSYQDLKNVYDLHKQTFYG